MQLYTVHLRQKKLISCFDSKGRKVGDKTEFITVKFTDLPWPTAKMYRDTSEEGACEIIRQEQVIAGSRSRDRVIFEGRETKPRGSTVAKARSQSAIQKAAATGDMAAAINQR
jgi:hypothetical protein